MALVATGASATQFWYDVITNYPGGCITTNSGGLWWAHLPGSLTANDALIVTNTYTSGAAVDGKRLSINGLHSEYIERWLDPTTGGITNIFSGGVLYASFVVNASYVPSGGKGTYFACFNDGGVPFAATNGFEFHGRVSEIGNSYVYPFTNTVPLTYRLGVATAADDLPNGPGPNAYATIDLVKGVDYQVVLKLDVDAASSTIWVNPASESDTLNMAGPTSDFGPTTNGFATLLFRQRTGGGTVDIRDIAVGTTFADVMTNSAATSPVLVATNFNTVTSYTGNPALLEVFASSIGGGPLSYQWYRISGDSTNPVGANSQTYFVASLAGSDTGNYFCAVTNSGGMGALSGTNFQISVNTTPTPPAFSSKPPASTNIVLASTLTLASAVYGSGPLSFAWTFNGNPLTDGSPVTAVPGDVSVVSGSQTPILTVKGVSTNETGTFLLTVTSGASGLPFTSTNTSVSVAVRLPGAVTIAFIRSLENTTTWQITDTSTFYTISNAVVTMFTNVTGGATASYYIQDATGGLDMFVTGDATFRPAMGDLVSISGTLSMYNNSIELGVTSGNPYSFYGITGHTNVLPAPVVFSLDNTNSPGLMETNFEGKIVMLTNVAFAANYTTGTSGGSGNSYVTNLSGGGPLFNIYLPAGTDQDVQNRVLPPAGTKVWTITGVLSQYKSGAYANSGYELYVTRIGDIVTTPPPAVTDLTATRSGNDVVLNWTAVPYTIATRGAYSYSVLTSTSVAGPYLPLATLAFNTTSGTYTHTNALLSNTQMFYRISSP